MDELIKYPLTEGEFIRLFRDAVYESELKFSCNDLKNAGIESDSEICTVLLKSIKSLKQAGLMPNHHFKHVYITELTTGITYHDWRISKMGFLLALIHSTGNNPVLNRWRIEMVRFLT